MLLIKVFLLIWYSNKKTVFKKIKLIFGLENWIWKLEMTNSYRLAILSLHKISKSPLSMLISKQKSYYFLYPLFENSISEFTIMQASLHRYKMMDSRSHGYILNNFLSRWVLVRQTFSAARLQPATALRTAFGLLPNLKSFE